MGGRALPISNRARRFVEPLTHTGIVEQTDVTPTKSDRVTIGKFESSKIDNWLEQINHSSKGFLSLTKSDLVNFLIRTHKDELIPKELSQIRTDHYDPIRHITWIAPQIKKALAEGNAQRVAELQEELRGVELSVIHRERDDSRPSKQNVDTTIKKRRQSKLKSPTSMTEYNAHQEANFSVPSDASVTLKS